MYSCTYCRVYFKGGQGGGGLLPAPGKLVAPPRNLEITREKERERERCS